jgi:hypothetical protein
LSEGGQVAGAGFLRTLRIEEEDLQGLVRLEPASLELVGLRLEEGDAALVLKVDRRGGRSRIGRGDLELAVTSVVLVNTVPSIAVYAERDLEGKVRTGSGGTGQLRAGDGVVLVAVRRTIDLCEGWGGEEKS